MIDFGISGVPDSMRDRKMTYSEIAEELKTLGLYAFEYPLTYGTNISDDKCREIGEFFHLSEIKLSVHAPYYINLASSDEEAVQKSFGHIYNSMKRAKSMGADRVVFHPGSLTKQTRAVAFNNVVENLKKFMEIINGDESVDGILICPETMGKHGQIGTPEEIYALCKISDRIIPTLDFGHINAFRGGDLVSIEKFKEIIEMFVGDLEKKEIHIHFSRIEYGVKGEKKHLTFETDPGFGPDENLMINALKSFNANFRIISESAGTQDVDAKIMLNYYKKGF